MRKKLSAFCKLFTPLFLKNIHLNSSQTYEKKIEINDIVVI